MNAKISEVSGSSNEPIDPVAAISADITEDDIASELGRNSLLIIKQQKYITALQAALREAAKK